VQRPRIAVLIGNEGEAGPAALGHDLIELALTGLNATMRLGIATARSVPVPRLGAGLRGGGQKYCRQPPCRASHRYPPSA
jgi:hypothetical protein